MAEIPEHLKEHALERLARGSYDVGAAVWRDISEPGLDGRAIRAVVTDGRVFEISDFTDGRMSRQELLLEPLEEAIEDRVCSICPREARMGTLRAWGMRYEKGRIPIKFGRRAVPAN